MKGGCVGLGGRMGAIWRREETDLGDSRETRGKKWGNVTQHQQSPSNVECVVCDSKICLPCKKSAYFGAYHL